MVKPADQKGCPAQRRGEACAVHEDSDSVVEMTALEILTGKGAYYPGLVPLVLVYLDSIGCDPDTSVRVKAYVDLIVKRAPVPKSTVRRAEIRQNFDHLSIEAHASRRAQKKFIKKAR